MPISKDRFEEIDSQADGGPKPGTNAARILRFLRAHPDEAFRQTELVDATGITSGSVGPTLVRLRDKGRVDHKANYWTISDHDHAVDNATELAASTLAAREGEDEAPELSEWESEAVDPREHRDE